MKEQGGLKEESGFLLFSLYLNFQHHSQNFQDEIEGWQKSPHFQIPKHFNKTS